MKLLSLVTMAVLATTTLAASGKGKPGYCDDDTQCHKSYTCVSVQTTREGVEYVKQCLPTNAAQPVCTGTVPGLCPSFSTTWGANFRQISSVCSYILPEGKGVKCLSDIAASDNSSKAVECLQIANPGNKSAPVGVIYGCVDFDGTRLLFDKTSKTDKLVSGFNYSAIIKDGCVNPKNPQGSTFVCSSQGTCSPNSAGSMEYSCKCNIGFSGKYCQKIEDNKCYNDGVCGGGSCDLNTNLCTACPAGTTGNKCAYCDPTYDATKVCSGHGKCIVSAGDSTLGADSSGSSTSAGSSSSSGSSVTKTSSNSTSSTTNSHSNSTSTSTSTNSTTSTTKKTTASTTKAGSSFADIVATVSPGKGAGRFLAQAYQCQCDSGYSDANCAVKIKVASNSSSTPAPSTSMAQGSLATSLAVVVLTVGAVLAA